MNLEKMKKEHLVENLRIVMESYELPKDTNEILNYVINNFKKNPRKVSREDLRTAVSHLQELTGKTLEKLLDEIEYSEDLVEGEEIVKIPLPQVENNKKDNKKDNKTNKLVPVKKDETEQQSTKKTNDTVKSNAKVTHQKLELLANFPNELSSTTLKDIARLRIRTDIKTISDVVKAYNNKEDIVIATYWTARHLKQYASSYDPMNINPNKPKRFEHDLDFIEITYANNLVVTGCSLFSYIPHIFLPTDFVQDEDTNLRYANGCEFQIYEVAEYRKVEEE